MESTAQRRNGEEDFLVRSLSVGLRPGHAFESHTHGWEQVVFASSGLLEVRTEDACWVVPPQRAIWVPAHLPHRVRSIGRTRMRTIYLHPSLGLDRGPTCVLLEVQPLARELILHVAQRGMLSRSDPVEYSLAVVLRDRLDAQARAPFGLPWPADARARKVADRVVANAGADLAIAELVEGSGASRRTIERLFVDETGLAFGRWRQQARLQEAFRRLAGGESVTQVALAVGYDSASSFIAMFKRQVGCTPGRLFD